MGQKIMALETQAYELAGQPFNLFAEAAGRHPVHQARPAGQEKPPPAARPTDEEVLTELALDYPLPKLLLEHRSLSKLKAPTPTSCRA